MNFAVWLALACVACTTKERAPQKDPPPSALPIVPIDASTEPVATVDAPIDAANRGMVSVPDDKLPVLRELTGPKVTIPRGGAKTLAGIKLAFTDYGGGGGGGKSLAMISLVASKSGKKEVIDLKSEGLEPEFVVFDRGFVVTSFGGQTIDVVSVPITKTPCSTLIDELVERTGVREPPSDDITGFILIGDGYSIQYHSGWTIACGGVSGRLVMTPTTR